jgi:hypothetical protein
MFSGSRIYKVLFYRTLAWIRLYFRANFGLRFNKFYELRLLRLLYAYSLLKICIFLPESPVENLNEFRLFFLNASESKSAAWMLQIQGNWCVLLCQRSFFALSGGGFNLVVVSLPYWMTNSHNFMFSIVARKYLEGLFLNPPTMLN